MSLTDDILMHYGMPRRSGRYPWGSGDNPYQHSGDFLSKMCIFWAAVVNKKDFSSVSLLLIRMEKPTQEN